MGAGLRLHSDTLCAAVEHIEVGVARPRAGCLVVSYVVNGRIGELRLPPVEAAARADDLWQHSCFEAFIRTQAGSTYYEFNFAPSTRWAAYRFGDYRSGRRVAEIDAPAIAVEMSPGRYALQALLELDGLSDLPAHTPWRLGLSAVIEDAGGGMSYWALVHPPGKPDFHHPVSFACEVCVDQRAIPANANGTPGDLTLQHQRARL